MDYQKSQKILEEKYVFMLQRITKEIELGVVAHNSIEDELYDIKTDITKEELASYINYKIFISISLLDINVLLKNLFSAKYLIEQNLFCRLLSVQIYEFINDFSKFNFQNINSLLEKEPQKTLRDKFYSKREQVLMFCKDNKDYYHQIRNNCGAHKDKSIKILNEFILKINIQEQMEKGKELLDLINSFNKITNDILEIIS